MAKRRRSRQKNSPAEAASDGHLSEETGLDNEPSQVFKEHPATGEDEVSTAEPAKNELQTPDLSKVIRTSSVDIAYANTPMAHPESYESIVPDTRAPFENNNVLRSNAPSTRIVKGDDRKSLRPLILHELHWSPFCGKVRAMLRCLRLPFVEMPVDTCTHATIRHLEPTHHHTPILEDPNAAGCVIGGSTPIIAYIDNAYNHGRLFPSQSVLDMCSELDKRLGMPARRLAYARMAIVDPGMFADLFFRHHHRYLKNIPGLRYAAGNYMALRVMLQYHLHENEDRNVADTLERYLQALDQRVCQNPHKFVVGSSLTAADITLAELLRPLRIVPRFSSQFPVLWQHQDRTIRDCNLSVDDEYRRAEEAFHFRSIWHAPTDAAALAVLWAHKQIASVLPQFAFNIDTQGSSENALHGVDTDEVAVRASRAHRDVGIFHKGIVRDLYHYCITMRPQVISTAAKKA